MSTEGHHSIVIDRSKLPFSDQQALQYLEAYFNGFRVDYENAGAVWKITLQKEDFTYCENFYQGLDGIRISPIEFNNFKIVTDRSCICLSESWIPYAWSNFLSTHGMPENLSIIHVDDHSDLMSPYIAQFEETFFDLFTRKSVILDKPQSIESAILSGAITIGSMLTPIVMSAKNVRVLHLKQNVETTVSNLEMYTEPDQLLVPGANRVAVRRDSLCKDSERLYLLTSDTDLLQQYIAKNSCVVLHIDMDFFNNRYNGSTSWKTDGCSLDPSFEEQRQRIDDLCQSLGRVNTQTPISCVYIGISPSFYPTEYWKKGVQYLLKCLSANYINVDHLYTATNQIFYRDRK